MLAKTKREKIGPVCWLLDKMQGEVVGDSDVLVPF